MDRQEWLERRRKGIGGTDAAAILGLSKYRTAIDVWAEKTGRRRHDREMTAPMKWGLLLEEVIARAYTEETGRIVRRVPIRKHPRLDFVIGSFDRLVLATEYLPGKILEIKTARSDDGYAERGSELAVAAPRRIPPMHYVQVQHYLGISGLAEADVAVLFGGSDFRIYPIPRDDEFIFDLYAELGLWWNAYVVGDVQPPVGPDDAAFLSRKYPRDLTEETIATPEIVETLEALLALRDRIDLLERDRDAMENAIKEYMGDAGKLISALGTVSWKANDRRTTGWKEVAGAYRKLAIERIGGDVILDELDSLEGLYTQSNTVRPFRVTRSKEKVS